MARGEVFSLRVIRKSRPKQQLRVAFNKLDAKFATCLSDENSIYRHGAVEGILWDNAWSTFRIAGTECIVAGTTTAG